MGGVVTDFSPLRLPLQWVEDVEKSLPEDVPFGQVDGHNIIPCWVTSTKQEFTARTIRFKINNNLKEFLTKFPAVIKHPYSTKMKYKNINWESAYQMQKMDKTVGPVEWAKPGSKAGLKMLHEFCIKRLKLFAKKKNDPNENALSGLSPWIHFGQISAQRCVLEVNRYRQTYPESVDAYFEECIVRRELADNFCFYQTNYDNINGAAEWARKTLEIHKKDVRPYLYSKKTLEKAKTHDDLWNSAQIQLIKEGKMHGALRMYWAKKILEWNKSPEEALSVSMYLNDRYSLDGRDPSGYVGCMISICGIHDQMSWLERNIFGKIRFMNYEGCKRKYNVKTFVARYGGKAYKYTSN
ncbi:Deoxyribodipyrimidine photo-lyase, partial [Armadillidium vulgare]